jgi:hypothetical protein
MKPPTTKPSTTEPQGTIIIRPVQPSDLQNVISLINREITGGINIFRLVPLEAGP